MEPTVQTSFIPRKPLTEEHVTRERPVGIFTFVGTVLFLASIVAAGGMYFYKANLTKSYADKSAQLEAVKNTFEPGLIQDLQSLDRRLDASSDILSNHIALSPIFDELSRLTLRSVRYTKFSYEIAKDTGVIKVKMSGQSSDYNSIALQAQAFNKSKSMKNIVFLNLTLDDHGKPSFDLEFTVDPAFVKYVGTTGSTIPTKSPAVSPQPITTQ